MTATASIVVVIPTLNEEQSIGDERVALRIGRDADLTQRMADLVHFAEDR